MAENHSCHPQHAPNEAIEPDPGNRPLPVKERSYPYQDDDGRTVHRCAVCPFNRPEIHKVKDHYRKVHIKAPYLCNLCDLRFLVPFAYQEHFKDVHTRRKHYKCECTVASYDREHFFDQHRDKWCPERPTRAPGWEGREWDFEKKQFEPVPSLPLASSSSRPAPPGPRRDPVFGSGAPTVDLNDMSSMLGEAQGYQPSTNNPSFLAKPYLNESAPFESPSHYQLIPNDFSEQQSLPFQAPYFTHYSTPLEHESFAQQPRTDFNSFELSQEGYPESFDHPPLPDHQLIHHSAFPSRISPSQLPLYTPADQDHSNFSFPPTPFFLSPQPRQQSFLPATPLASTPHVPIPRLTPNPIVLDPLLDPIQRSSRRRGGGSSVSSRPPHPSAREPYSRSQRPSHRSAPIPDGVSRHSSQIEDYDFGSTRDNTLQRSFSKLSRRQARYYDQDFAV